MLKNAPPSTFWNVPLHDWGRRLTVWAENPTSRINCSRRMQPERSGMPNSAMLRDRQMSRPSASLRGLPPPHPQ